MNIVKKVSIIGLATLVITFFSGAIAYRPQEITKISAQMQTEVLSNGKKIRINAGIYWQKAQGKMLTHYTYPSEYYYLTNNMGEIKLYFPDKNEVQIKQNDLLSSENDILYYFLSNQTQDMGLYKMGFTSRQARMENTVLIQDWYPPADLQSKLKRVEIVSEDYLPIYTAYIDPSDKIIRKIFYTQYSHYNEISIPLTITEFNYLPTGDSVISRKQYKDIRINYQAQSTLFDFSIPDNAKIIK